MRNHARTSMLAALTLGAMLAGGLPAGADVVTNDIVTSVPGEARRITIPVGGSAVVRYFLEARTGGGDAIPGCNATETSPAEVTVQAPVGVDASPASFAFTDCVGGSGVSEVAVTYTSSTLARFSGGSLDPQGHLIRVTVSGQGSYQTSQASFRLLVQDVTPPHLTVPADIHLTTTGGSVQVEYTVDATDATDPSPRIVCDPPSGSAFPPGTTVVACSATDESGNATAKTFTVAVLLPHGHWAKPGSKGKELKSEIKGGSTESMRLRISDGADSLLLDPALLDVPGSHVTCASGMGGSLESFSKYAKYGDKKPVLEPHKDGFRYEFKSPKDEAWCDVAAALIDGTQVTHRFDLR